MRLIDADALRWLMRNNAPHSVPLWVYQTIDNAPTAYDPEKVVEQLKEASYTETQDDMNPCDPPEVVNLESAIKIVRGGGVDEV